MQPRGSFNLLLTCALAASCASRAPAPVPDVRPSGPVQVSAAGDPVPAGGRVTPAPVAPPVAAPLEVAEGEATYYADRFDGRRAASGIVFQNAEPYAAHRTYPFGTVVRVTNLVNDRSVEVRIIDRGPHGSSARARRTIIDLSQSAARELDFIRAGRVPVRVEVLEWGTRVK